jgi:hypothetical protein
VRRDGLAVDDQRPGEHVGDRRVRRDPRSGRHPAASPRCPGAARVGVEQPPGWCRARGCGTSPVRQPGPVNDQCPGDELSLPSRGEESCQECSDWSSSGETCRSGGCPPARPARL